MIEVIGPEDREEYRFARKLADDMVELWPDLEESEDRVQVAASAKVFGGRTQDIDVIVLARFRNRSFRPRRLVRIIGAEGDLGLYGGEIGVRNLLLTIEVKGHAASGIRFDGLNVVVRYGSDRKSATDQSMDQMNALRTYIGNMARVAPFVINLVALESLPASALPARPHNIIGGDQNFASILNAICELKAPWRSLGRPTLTCCKDEDADRVARLPIFNPLTPTELDRKRMERLSASSPQIEAVEPHLGWRQLILRGHGGAGKTSMLLQLAKRAYDERAARSLILTYNLALAADIRRLMALAGVPTSADEGGIRVETVMSFVNRVARHLRLLDAGDDLLSGYEERADELAEMLESGAIEAPDIERLVRDHEEELRYDLVMIDEGQDWPRNEIAIVRAIYGAEKIVVADGIDQFVRGAVADWRAGVDAHTETERLHRSLRMKASLARFANAMAEELGAPGWKVRPNPDAPGGRVIVIEGRLGDEIALHEELEEELRRAGNAPIDLLYCVPPSMVEKAEAGRVSHVATMLRSHGRPVWDGASQDARRDIPRDTEAARVVQYHSCRGLEGWTVVAAALDRFWDQQQASADLREGDLASPAEQARRHAARWCMIPLSRAMDTLVISIDDAGSEMGRALRSVAARMPDVVEWRS